ncbi:hypothetical protein [Streptomyces mayteni]
MATWEEFTRLHEAALAEQGIGPRRDVSTVASSAQGDGTDGTLVVGDGTLEGAARVIRESILGDTRTAGRTADVRTSYVVQMFRDWELARGLASVITRWERKADMLAGRLESDAEALHVIQLGFIITDSRIGHTIQAVENDMSE